MPPKNRGKILNLLALTLCTGLLFNANCFSAVYKVIDERGKVTFSDQPAPEADKVDIREPNSAKPIEPLPAPIPTDEAVTGYQLSIKSPLNNSIIANGLVPFNVVAEIFPTLKKGHRLQLKINSEMYATSTSSNFQVNGINRGQHILQIDVIDDLGQVITGSEIINISALRPHK